MKVAVLGASKGMGRSVARELASQGHTLCLLGRNVEELERSARDIEIRSGLSEGSVQVVECDLEQADSFTRVFDQLQVLLNPIEAVVVTAGLFGTQEELENDTKRLERLLTVNFTHTILFCEEARKRLLAQGGGSLCVFSSVAGDRGRKPVILYGASKAGLSHYLEGLDHKYRSQGLVTLNVKPGFVKTGMTYGLKPPPFAGEPDQVAKQVVKALTAKSPLLYTPSMWRWVMFIIRNLPRFVMRRLSF
ncbi:MAG: SDR family NAD(P)-dependent oxidoreductase [Myxococcales bacterium]|nr:MAG: SDR family NAD(P)-dependent oxidoreductase [Myxococcales bacterium]